MEISSALAQAAPATNTATADQPAIDSDFETFLRMLTVQMQNQDPLNPTKAEDFAVQLATFASVEQQVFTNDLLEAMQLQMGLSGVSEFANWIGKEARAPTFASFDGETPIDVAVSPDPNADEAYLVVKNTDGLEVDRYPIDLDDSMLQYDGTTAGGSTLPEGEYSFTVENWIDGGADSFAQAEVYTKVTEARIVDGQIVLVTEGGVEISTEQVSALREPEAA